MIEDVVEVLDREPLVTLWGPGGVGKTRVAVRVARLRWSAATTGSDPVHFVDLAAVEPSGRVGDALLAAIGAQPWADESEVEAAARVLRPSRALVVMDNCEHVLPAVRLLVAALLASCPDLRVLLTESGDAGAAQRDGGAGRTTRDAPRLGSRSRRSSAPTPSSCSSPGPAR